MFGVLISATKLVSKIRVCNTQMGMSGHAMEIIQASFIFLQ